MTKRTPKSMQYRHRNRRFAKHNWYVLGMLTVLGLAPAAVFALGSRIPNQDAEAIGRGNAFVATADDPSAIYYNPAGITQLDGNNLQVGSLFYLNIYADYRSPSGEQFENKRSVLPVPQVHYVFTPKNQPFS